MEEVINFLESHQGSGVFSRPHIDFSSNFSRNLEFHLNKREKMDVVQLLQRQFIDYMKSLFMELVSKLTKHIVRTYQVCNVEFKYTDELNPKRFLTSPSDAVFNDGHDNSQTQQSYLMESLVYKASAYIMQTPPDNCVPIATANAYKIVIALLLSIAFHMQAFYPKETDPWYRVRILIHQEICSFCR
ncbi:uncharacterized protein LOC104905818 isoform X6 [Beta vulgaris subsp. vulgaris]|uniref:uncharacterized protein LOC104905818 isoform X6 n=1 Tax=Beta vulgaris subsp. vulgaris TaxID=3555 RepID=UPI002548AFC9|nr:uncharacterized protein LOC104905818 isoform X6 [Beta vulgaris subsp. vulgaris]